MPALLALGLDVGTSSARAFVFDAEGRELGGGQVEYEWATTTDGGVEVDPEVIVAAAAESVDAVLHSARHAGPIAAVGLTALWHSLLGLDAAGRPVTPVYPWSDTRATGAAARLRHELDPAEVHRRTGAALHPSYLPARLRWLDDTRPQLFRAARFWASIAEYLELRLFGQRRVSISMASGTGLLDQHTLEWDPEVLGAARIDADQLSPLVDLDCAARELAEPFRSRWPALAHVPWYSALGDGACANVGSGCIGPERIALSLGTSGALRLLDATDDPAIPPDLWCYRLDRGHALWGGAVSNGGNVYAWLRRTLHLPSPTEFEQWLCEAPADAHGLTVLPFLAGERSPFFPLGATMSIAGLTLDTPPEAIAQAAMEAVAIRLSLIRDALREHHPEAGVIVASGAALSHSPAWAQIIADVFGEPIVVAPEEEASSRGAALLALRSVGAIPALPADPEPAEIVLQPDPRRHERYVAARERQLKLESSLSDEDTR